MDDHQIDSENDDGDFNDFLERLQQQIQGVLYIPPNQQQHQPAVQGSGGGDQEEEEEDKEEVEEDEEEDPILDLYFLYSELTGSALRFVDGDDPRHNPIGFSDQVHRLGFEVYRDWIDSTVQWDDDPFVCPIIFEAFSRGPTTRFIANLNNNQLVEDYLVCPFGSYIICFFYTTDANGRRRAYYAESRARDNDGNPTTELHSVLNEDTML